MSDETRDGGSAPRSPGRLASLLGHDGHRFEDSDAMREHLSLVLVAMATEDGDLADDEMLVMRRVLADDPLFAGDGREVERCLRLSLEILHDEYEYAERLRRALSRFEDAASREIVAAMILAIVHADGVETLYEADFQAQLLDHLGIDPGRVPELVSRVIEPFLEALR